MADTPKQSPLGANFTSSLLKNEGLNINPLNLDYIGKSRYNKDYTPGKLINDTCLKWITYAVNAAYQNGAVRDTRIPITSVTPAGAPPYTKYVIAKLGDTNWNRVAGTTGIDYEEGNLIEVKNVGYGTGYVFLNGEQSKISVYNYDNLLAIGASRLPALANGLPPTYLINDPSNLWQGQATTGYAIPGDGSNIEVDKFAGQGQDATWFPYNSSNPNVSVTQWGFLRCLTLQAWNVFNWNGITPADEVEYKNYVTSFNTIEAFYKFNNENILALRNAVTFMEGVFSNMNDLMSADITGVSLSTQAFGQDLINLGKILDLSKISTFGLPSNLLQTLQKNNALTQPLILTLLVSGLSQSEIDDISSNSVTPTKDQEQKIYSAYLLITGADLIEILKVISVKTKGIEFLSDLLSVKKLFPISFTSLTVPIYNTIPGPTNSKTYYLLFVDREMNPQLVEPKIKEIVGTIVPAIEPPITLPPPILPTIEAEVIQQVSPQVPQPNPEIPAPPPNIPSIITPPLQPIGPDVPIAYGQRGNEIIGPGRGGGGGCVALESFVPLVETEQKHNGREITRAWMLESGMKISLGTDGLEIVNGSVVKTLNDYQPCVRISTADGIALVCSTSAPILTKDKGFIPATEVYGKRVAVMRNGRTWYDEVVQLEDVGMKFVRVIDAGNNSFWAGERPGAFILHHNIIINDEFRIDKN